MRDEDEKPLRPASHAIGESLDRLSVEEIAARIALLTREIARLEAAGRAKTAAREAAGSIFKL